MANDDIKPSSPETASSSSQPSSSEPPQHSQVPPFSSFAAAPYYYYNQMFPAAPYQYQGLTPSQNHQPVNGGAGIYAVTTYPFNPNLVTGLPYNTLIPLTYTTPTRPTSEGATVGENQGQESQQPQPQQQQPAPQRQVVRRFEVVIRIDLFLMLKLATMIFVLNDGSRQRLVVLVLFASLVYLYQTGTLTPIIRQLSEAMQRAAAPPHPPRPAPRVQNVPAARPEADNAAPAGQPEAGIMNQQINDADGAAENENAAEPGGGNGDNRWWGIVKEIQMIVFGFITSLLPGFHNHNLMD